MAVSFNSAASSPAVDVAAGAASLVANLIAPGSGVVVGKVVKAGAAVVSGLITIFNSRKAQGKSDAIAAYEAAQAATEADRKALFEASTLTPEYLALLPKPTEDDKKVSRLLKEQKMRGEAGKYTLQELFDAAVKAGQINPQGLDIFKEMSLPGASSDVLPPLGGHGSQPSYSVGGAVPGQAEKEPLVVGGSSPWLLIIMSFLAFILASPFLFYKSYTRRRRNSYGYNRRYYSSSTRRAPAKSRTRSK